MTDELCHECREKILKKVEDERRYCDQLSNIYMQVRNIESKLKILSTLLEAKVIQELKRR
tara:strand:- start:566 stop:745 length:180 start_codon:yes stop_codon:yes gene_type:complete